MDGLIDTLKKAVQRDESVGVSLVKVTGKVLDEDKTYIEVDIHGRLCYAKMSMPFGWFSVPNEEWLEKYAGEIGAWIVYEKGNSAFPVIIGFNMLDDKAPSLDSYPRTVSFKTTEFEVLFDDEVKEYRFKKVTGDNNDMQQQLLINEDVMELRNDTDDYLSIKEGEIIAETKDGQQLEITKGTVLGKKNASKEKAALGETTKGLLSDLIDAILKLTLVSPSGETGTAVNLADFQAIKAKLDTMLSNSVKLD